MEITFACKTTAVQALICLYTFRRWVDPTRIRWEHCDRIVNQGRIFLKFKLSASKSNRRGQRNEYITLQQNNLDLCPIRIYSRYVTCDHKVMKFVIKCQVQMTLYLRYICIAILKY